TTPVVISMNISGSSADFDSVIQNHNLFISTDFNHAETLSKIVSTATRSCQE
ncbi:hypothetical protein L873DRAFT_1821433, partial [Choiromyces venosus 120613-1]